MGGTQGLSDDEAKAKGPEFLFDELRQRVAAGQAAFDFRLPLAQPGDRLDSAVTPLPDDRRKATLGRLTIKQVAADRDGQGDHAHLGEPVGWANKFHGLFLVEGCVDAGLQPRHPRKPPPNGQMRGPRAAGCRRPSLPAGRATHIRFQERRVSAAAPALECRRPPPRRSARPPETTPMKLTRMPARLAALSAIPLALSLMAGVAHGSSHREAPFITTAPKVDATDFYMFRSYEEGRSEYVTLLANYLPLQDAYGGPNYFAMDPNALYEIHVDNNGDAKEDITFQFRFRNRLAGNGAGAALSIGGKMVNIPLIQAGQVANPRDASLQLNESFSVSVVRGDRRKGAAQGVTQAGNGGAVFDKPVDNIGTKTIPNYAEYAGKHVYTVNIPGCAQPGRVFVGQRQDPFAVNLGTIFDLVNAPVGVITDPAHIGAAPNTIGNKNVTTLALEVHRSCLKAGEAGDDVIGGWTTASLRQARVLDGSPPSGHQTTERAGGAWVQVSRLGMPLVNEVVIGLKDKDKFNASKPMGDAQFIDYVTNPTLPALLEVALGLPGIAPSNFPRTDLVTTFLTGIKGVNQPRMVTPSEMLRLNTAIAPVPFAQQNRLGVVGNLLAGGIDNAGFPNGRRPKDDVVDIALVAVMGGLCMANGTTDALGFGAACNPSAVPLKETAFKLHDAVDQAVAPLLPAFPYLNTPLPGAR